MRSVTGRKKRVVWAVDPFCEENCSLMKSTARAVSVLASQLSAVIEPVYLLGEMATNVRLFPVVLRDIQRDAQNELSRIIRGLALAKVAPIKVLVSPHPGLHEMTDLLIAYSKESDASAIAVGTRARKGLSRALIGSFAETLILKSDVPLYVINPREKPFGRIRRVLFPTDFSGHSRAAFEQIVEFALEMDASITLLHRIKYDWTPVVQASVVANPVY